MAEEAIQTDGTTTETTERERGFTGIYWTGFKLQLVLPVLLFVSFVIVGGLAGFPDDMPFATYPLLNTLLLLFVLDLFLGPLLLVYLVSRDKRERAKVSETVNTYHWITIGVFTVFSSGVYLLWYAIARWRNGKRLPDSGSNPREQLRSGRLTTRLVSVATRVRDAAQRATGGNPLSSGDSKPVDGRSAPDAETLRTQAERAVEDAETAADRGEYGDAMVKYDDGIERYEASLDRLNETAGDERRRAIEGALADARRSRDALQERRQRVDDVRDHLRGAEQSFRTAIIAHVGQRYTVAERDYRQARDRYEQALATLEETDYDVLAEGNGVTVTVEAERDQLPRQLADWPGVSEAEEAALAEVGIGTLTDVKDVGSEAIDEFRRRDEISDGLANRLQAVTWWHGDAERTFTGTVAIERQRDRASDGQRLL